MRAGSKGSTLSRCASNLIASVPRWQKMGRVSRWRAPQLPTISAASLRDICPSPTISQRLQLVRHGRYTSAANSKLIQDELLAREVMAALRRRRVSDDGRCAVAHDTDGACQLREGLGQCAARL